MLNISCAKDDDRQMKILKYLQTNSRMTISQIQEMFDISRDTANRILRLLLDSKLVNRKGKGKATYYSLAQRIVRHSSDIRSAPYRWYQLAQTTRKWRMSRMWAGSNLIVTIQRAYRFARAVEKQTSNHLSRLIDVQWEIPITETKPPKNHPTTTHKPGNTYNFALPYPYT